ncbi:MAG: hypothetical protein ACYC6Y_13245 [Thermoguttaceae bacterium]
MSNSTDDQYVAPEVVEKRGMSGGAKILIVLGIVFLLCILVCCGGGILVSVLASRWAKEAVSLDPAVIAQRQSEILDLQIPQSFRPQTSVDMAVPMTNNRLMRIVSYAGPSAADSITLVEIGELMAGQPEQQMRQQIEQSLQQQGIGPQDSPGQWETHQKEYTIAGKPASFTFRIGKDEKGNPTRLEASGMVAGKSRPVLVTVSVGADTLNEEQVDEMIRSIR